MTENQAMILEAANKAIDNVNKGYEINDDRIRTTFKDNLERAEDNKDRWTRSFNQAMQNINDNNKYKSNLYNDYKIS
jgi:polyhydroxyalkanoate synthesis regulator phasin